MFNVDRNNICYLTRGDSVNIPLYLNAGSDLIPLQYILKDYIILEDTAVISLGSIITEGSVIKSGSIVNNTVLSNDLTLLNTVTIISNTNLLLGSKIMYNSVFKANSYIGRKRIPEDTLIHQDEVYLSIMEPNQPFEDGLIKKKYTKDNLDENNNIIINLKHEDTKCLLPGKYYYQIKAKFNDNNTDVVVNTVVQKTELFITE